jgi:hypothetical protein
MIGHALPGNDAGRAATVGNVPQCAGMYITIAETIHR